MAVTEGFEPSIHVAMYDDLANRCLQPLGHVTLKKLALSEQYAHVKGKMLCLAIQLKPA
jgi:hypothetical protein